MEEDELIDRRAIPKRTWRDYGIINEGQSTAGVTGARHITTEDGTDYIAKTDGWMETESGDAGTHILLQEWICARLAKAVGVPVSDYSLINFYGVICFGSEKLPLYAPRFAPEVMAQVVNPEALYDIIVFDTWLHNCDRHPSNLVVATDRQVQRLLAIDHSHCPIYGAEDVSSLISTRDEPASVAVQSYLRGLITDRICLARSVSRVQDVADEDIRALVTPPDLIPHAMIERNEIAEFLIYRRDRLKSLFNMSRYELPAISEHPL